MNEQHSVIGNYGGKCRVLEWVPSELDPDALVAVFQTKSDFIARYSNRQLGWKMGKPITLGQWWVEHPRRSGYRGVVFKPAKPAVITRGDHGDYLNLWKGWGVVPRKGRWPLMRDHIEQILSAGDPKAADYNIKWIAWGYQHADEQAEAANVLRGPKGGGKSVFCGQQSGAPTALTEFRSTTLCTLPGASTLTLSSVVSYTRMKPFGLVISKARRC